MDALDQEIESKRAELSKLDKEREKVMFELQMLERAASLRPSAHKHIHLKKPVVTPTLARTIRIAKSTLHVEAGRRGGKPKGAISPGWRTILGSLYSGGPYAYRDFLAAAHRHNIQTNATAVRDRVRALVANGFLAGNSQDGFTVTETAAERFEFANQDRATLTNEAASATPPWLKEIGPKATASSPTIPATPWDHPGTAKWPEKG